MFDGMIMGLQQVMGKQTYDEVKVNKISFWIQNHILPLDSFKESTIRRTGDVQEVCFAADDGTHYKDTVCIHVIMYLQKRFKAVVRMKSKSRWILVKYEKLPENCRYCGIVTHGKEDYNRSYNLRKIPCQRKRWA